MMGEKDWLSVNIPIFPNVFSGVEVGNLASPYLRASTPNSSNHVTEMLEQEKASSKLLPQTWMHTIV